MITSSVATIIHDTSPLFGTGAGAAEAAAAGADAAATAAVAAAGLASADAAGAAAAGAEAAVAVGGVWASAAALPARRPSPRARLARRCFMVRLLSRWGAALQRLLAGFTGAD